MDELVETWIDKTGWGDGPWQAEPDRVEWRHRGVPCLARRADRQGNWCGYAAVPPGHPWHGQDYGAGNYETLGPAHDAAHGGLTFASACMEDDRPQRERVCHVPQPGEPDDVWWLGFDCAHAYDLRPGGAAFERSVGLDPIPYLVDHQHYRDLRYVRARVEAVADAILEAR